MSKKITIFFSIIRQTYQYAILKACLNWKEGLNELKSQILCIVMLVNSSK